MARPGDDMDRDILDIIPERFDADADSRQARAGHHLRTGLTLAFAVVAVGAIVAAGLHFVGGRQVAGPGLPVIKADDRPIKTRPDDRGGMQVPNQDKLVYERMDGNEASGDGKVERLLPPPEQPRTPPKANGPAIDLPSPKPAAPEMIKPPGKGEPPAPKSAPQQRVAVQAVEPPPTSVPPIAGPPIAGPATPAPAAKAPPPPGAAVTPPPQVAAVAPPKAPAAGDYVIQLGAVRAGDAAEKEWTRIQKTYHDLLGALKSDIVRVELEGKGTFWRVRAGPLSEAAARQLCVDLTSRGQGCILARK